MRLFKKLEILKKAYTTIGFVMLILIFSSSCINSKLNVSTALKKSGALNYTISNVKVLNNQIILTGTGLENVTQFKIKESGVESVLTIESKDSTHLVANSISNVTFGLNKMLDFVLSNAEASSGFTVNFSLCDGILGTKGFSCATPTNGQVLTYDSASSLWIPRTISALHYVGTWNPTDLNYPPSRSTSGDYYVVSTTGTHAADGEAYTVGDQIVWSDAAIYEKVSTSLVLSAGSVTSVFGRSGPAITATKGDYNLNLLTDIDLTTNAPVANDILQYDGAKWVPGTVILTESDPTVKAFAKAVLPTCAAGTFLKGDGTNLSCVSGAFSGTANKVVATNGSGALAVTAISDTVLGYLSGVTSDIQTQINAKANSSSIVDWSSAGVAPTIDPSRLSLGVSNAGKAVITNGSGLLAVSATTSTEVGYLSGVTSNIQTQLSNKASAFSLGNNLVPVTNGSGALVDSTITTTKLGYLSGVTSDIQTQLGAKQATIDKTTTQDVSKLRVYGANTTYYTELSSGTLTANRSLIFPDANGSSGNVLSTNGSGVLSWIPITSGTVTSVNGYSTAAITLTTTDVAEGTNKYYTDARVRAVDLTGYTVASSVAAVATTDTTLTAFGKVQKQINDVLNTLLTGLTAGTNAVIATGDSILGAFAKLQAQITAQGTTIASHTTSIAAKADASNTLQTITANIVNGLATPTNPTEAANKSYVDTKATQWTTSSSDIYFTTVAAGKVGIGIAAPNSKFEVANGSITTAYSAISSLTADFSTANVISTTVAAGTLVLSNMRDGTSYTLIVQNTGSYVLSGSSVTTWRCAPACTSNTITNSSGHVLITILKAGTTAYVSYIGDM